MLPTAPRNLNAVTRARAGLVLDYPFFGALALRLEVIPSDAVPVAAVDGKTLKYNPAHWEALPPGEARFILAHEVLHCALLHHTRRGSRDGETWNKATDYAVNEVLETAQVGTMPAGALYNPAFSGMSAEKIYAILKREEDDQKQGQPQGGGAANGPAQEAPSPTGTVDDAPPSTQPGAGQPAPGQGPQQMTEAEQSAEENAWQVATTQAAQAAKVAGKLPGGMERLVSEIIAPVMDWREALRAFVTASREDYTWSRPNRRHIWRGVYLPGVHSEALRDVVVAVDTSGSIDPETLAAFSAELTGILEDFQGSSLRVVYCDAQIQGTQEHTSDNLPVTLEAKGGGGTDFSPVFDWVEEENLTPPCLVYLTDLEGRFPAETPPYPVLWVVWGGSETPPPFGDALPLDPDA